MSSAADVLIIGAGLAGLNCARTLSAAGVNAQILEATEGVGGRVRTDTVDGFLLDRGFQVLFTAYPEVRATLDLPALRLKSFSPGAFTWFGGRIHKLIDPWRTPGAWKEALQLDFPRLMDKLRIARLRARLRKSSIDGIFKRPDRSTQAALTAEGFSEEAIHNFFRPLFSGILLDTDLQSSSRMFEFVFKMLSEGDSAVPAQGMQAIPDQLASKLPPKTVRLNAKVDSLHENEIALEGGETLRARAIVVAADGPSAAHLVGEAEPASRSVTCFYYAAGAAPVPHPMLLLNGDGSGPVNYLAVMSEVAPSYAPAGQSLISISVLGTHQLTDQQLSGFVIAQMKNWFGDVARSWRLLRVYRIPHAQPRQRPGTLEPPQRPVRIRPGVYLCGDHRDNASINGALESGRRAAEAVIADLAR